MLKMRGHAVAASILAYLSLAAGHGGGHEYTIDGVAHVGNWDRITAKVKASIQRQWNWNGFMSPADTGTACGDPGKPHANSYHAPVTAGSVISIDYHTSEWEPSKPPITYGHPIGPMLVYMAACPDQGCEGVDVNEAIWFKTWEAGLLTGNWTEGYWRVRDVYEGASWDVPMPASLRPGKYLLRHEMINLQSGPVQFFPNCIQLDVSGEGSSLPAAEELVSFPGAYFKDEDKSFTWNHGAEWFYIEHAGDTVYPMPGPPLWQG